MPKPPTSVQIIPVLQRELDRTEWRPLKHAWLATTMGVTPWTVSRALERLIAWGYVDVRRSHRGLPSYYRWIGPT